MRTTTRNHARQFAAAVLIAGAALDLSPVAHAATAEASASVVIVEPVGAGFSFDILSDTVSAVFLNGDAGDSVSLLMSGRKPGGQSASRESGVVVMASGVYRIDLLQSAASPARLRSTIRAASPGGSSILFLAQFN
ncbi:hypothetical protein [Novosphingobium taihuense]|uniref:Uncharacterized protein n=1 Tax=Novosphingobium taihuense TaxID=260085 RepID=A0A7W7A8C1_9SPHN|nr:hypothetical protein [Novosphingobium taihuense]MBB4612141.1 hypothetical protein [Novosphingobium taihuense]TWH88505.1 hypothetical protein IQ25_00627 [Novosphingobium taihuense]